jgi:hypothetical protein
MKAPIIVVSDDVDVFEDVKAAERYLEPPEVRSGMRLYDRDARPIQALVVKRGPRFFGTEHVQLADIDGAEPDSDEVRALLTRFLRALEHVPESAEPPSLDDLWNRAIRYRTR